MDKLNNTAIRTAFFVSDSTGITAETLGHSLLAQFPGIHFEKLTIPYINSVAKAQKIIAQINAASQKTQAKALVFSTLANSEIRAILATCNGLFMDFFDILMGPLEKELQAKYSQDIGKFHSILDTNSYDQRISAVDFALYTDDGIGIKHYENADVILIGVSRCGKTPTCLYLALKFGIFAANYPITEEDMYEVNLPKPVQPYISKLFGLTISVERLQSIREQRKPGSRYATKEQCQQELKTVLQIFNKSNIPYLDSTTCSIEEIATKIMAKKKINRRSF